MLSTPSLLHACVNRSSNSASLFRTMRSLMLSAAVVIAASSSAFAQRELTNIPDPDPEIERQSFIVADGFEVNLYAADPRIAKPIQMNFDPQGRLWIASSEIYPHIEPGKIANDKILVVTDTNGDGVADETSVFAEGLLIPTGVEPGDGGAYVANSTELVHFADLDHDGRADQKRTLLSGFGTEDTHHIIHTFRWGIDGALYFNQSIYIHSHVETPWGVRRLGGGGIWQFRPASQRLEIFCRGFVNTWGHEFDRWGQSFATDGAGGEGINYVFPGSVFLTAPGAPRILKGLNPGSPKYCGLEVVSGSHLPDDWQGNLITNDFRGHRVCRFVLTEDGSGFASREQKEVIKTEHVAFRPIDVKMGPDGAIYIADWYNPIIQHGEVDFRDPRRDHTHGRIWRVTAKGRPLVKRPQLVSATVPELLTALSSSEGFTRRQASRVLQERGAPAVVPALKELQTKLGKPTTENTAWLTELLWLNQAVGNVDSTLLEQLLRAENPQARAAAVRVLSGWNDRIPNVLALLESAVTDAEPRVRLEAVRALSEIRKPAAAELAVRALDYRMDQFLDFAVWQTMRDLEPVWLGEFIAGKIDFDGKGHRQIFALQAINSPRIVAPLVRLIQQGHLEPAQVDVALNLVANLGGPTELQLAFDSVLGENTSREQRLRISAALREAALRRGVRPQGDLSVVIPWTRSDDVETRAAAWRLAGAWQLAGVRESAETVAATSETSPAERRACFDGLVSLGGDESMQVLRRLGAPTMPMPIRLGAAAAMIRLNADAAINDAVDILAAAGSTDDTAEVFATLFDRRNGGQMLIAALNGKQLNPDVARNGIRQARSTGRDVAALIAALSTAGQIASGERMLSPEELLALVNDVREHGSAARGETIFRRSNLNCLKCHAITGAGGQVGPDMSSIGASAQIDYLIESLLTPNKAVKEGYNAITVLTTDGLQKTGVKLRQTDTEIVLRNSDDEPISIPVSQVEEQVPAISLMPAGLTDELTREELVDLVRFLSELGKVGDYAPSLARVARRWEVLRSDASGSSNFNRGTVQQAMSGPSNLWTPFYSRVSGNLDLAEMPLLQVGADSNPMSMLRCKLTVTTAGAAALSFNRSRGVQAWIDGDPITVDSLVTVQLSPGEHVVTVAVNRRDETEGLRLELRDPPAGQPAANVQFVGGK